MSIPDGLRYTKEHEWISLEPDSKLATVGITHYAQESLGDVTFIELPEVGSNIKQDDTFGVVESVKAVSDLYAPVTGSIKEINSSLVETPELVNQDPYGEAWMIKIQVSDLKEEALMTAAQYKSFVEEQS